MVDQLSPEKSEKTQHRNKREENPSTRYGVENKENIERFLSAFMFKRQRANDTITRFKTYVANGRPALSSCYSDTLPHSPAGLKPRTKNPDRPSSVHFEPHL